MGPETENVKLWGGRFSGSTDPVMEKFNASLPFDKIMWKEDIQVRKVTRFLWWAFRLVALCGHVHLFVNAWVWAFVSIVYAWVWVCASKCICMNVAMWIYMYMHERGHVHLYVYAWACAYICLCVSVGIYIYMSMHECGHVHIYINTWVWACASAYIFICMSGMGTYAFPVCNTVYKRL